MNKIDKLINDELNEFKINTDTSSDKYSIENFNKYLQSVIEHLPKNGAKNVIALKKFNSNQNYLQLNKKKK